MNKAQQKRLGEAESLLRQAIEIAQEVLDEEQAAFDDLTERQQESQKGEAMQEAIDTIEAAISDAENAAEALAGLVMG